MLTRTVKSCGPDISTLVSSLAEAKSGLPGADQPYPWGDGGKTARSPGRARNRLLKPLRAGMLGVSGKPVVTTAGAAVYPFLPARLRVHWAPGIPHALFGRKINAQLGRIAPRDREAVSDQRAKHCVVPANAGTTVRDCAPPSL